MKVSFSLVLHKKYFLNSNQKKKVNNNDIIRILELNLKMKKKQQQNRVVGN